MKLKILVVLQILSVGCGNQQDLQHDVPVRTFVDRFALAERRLEVERLGTSCRADDIARLVTIAAGLDLDPSSPPLRDVRCAALQRLSLYHPAPHHASPVVLGPTSAALDQASIRSALSMLLADGVPWCTGRLIDDNITISPSEAASGLLVDFPVASLEQELDRAAARDDTANGKSRARAALVMLKHFLDYREGKRAARIDEMIAEGTPRAFDQLLRFIADGMPWDDGNPPATGAEAQEIQQHIYDALIWLIALATPARAGMRDVWRWDCERDVRKAVVDGDLGRQLLDTFEKLDVNSRESVLYWLPTMKPRGFAEWRLVIAKEDPDSHIRDMAARDPTVEHPRSPDAGVTAP